MTTDHELHARFLAKRDQLYAWAQENKDLLVRMALFGEVPDEAVLANVGMIAIEALLKHVEEVHQEQPVPATVSEFDSDINRFGFDLASREDYERLGAQLPAGRKVLLTIQPLQEEPHAS